MKNILLGIGGLVVLLIIVLVTRTFLYGGAPEGVQSVDLPDPPAVSAETAAQHLSEAIQFRTITVAPGDPRPGQEGPWLDLQAWLEETYPAFHAAAGKETVPGGLTLLYTWQGSDPSLKPLLLMAHQDVVPVNIGTEGDWDAPPFSGEIKNGYVYGRGAIDDKGSLIGIMEALDALARDGFEPRRTILVQLGHNEEISGSGAQAGIQLLQDRGVEPVMALDEGFMVLETNPLTGGTLGFIGIAEKGYLTLKITAKGEGGHSSQPPHNSATVRLSRALVALDENQLEADFSKPPISDMMRVVSMEMGFVPRMAMANQWLFGGMLDSQFSATPAGNAMIRTTTAPTMLSGSAKENVLAQRAMAIVNFRIHPNNTPEQVMQHVRDLTDDIGGIEVSEAEGSIGSEASPVSAIDNRAYGVLNAVAGEVGRGAPVTPALVLGATDSRYAAAITDDVYRFMPAIMTEEDITGFHGTNERITVENMGRLARGYGQIVLAMDAGEE
ncbi:M20 family peptidase [Henriciella aquimarina]|uniref:M20 family peptidase n=1 Tax=Henriciella aquimarina TaxID=545261 RepID=UPI000A041141|nr:M20 family peptidase [Henriciella aquimarina]